MIETITSKGEKLILLTEAEFRTLARDAGDAALAAEAADSPVLPLELARQVLEDDMHPLAAWRKAAGLSQAQLAARAKLRAASVCDIETGKIDPRYGTVKALADALGLEPGDIMR